MIHRAMDTALDIAIMLPWLMLLVGSVRKVYGSNDRLQRLQVEGAFLIFSGMLVSWIFFDKTLGRDPDREGRFAFWYENGEHGLYWIGLLLFGLGEFLERRPRPGLKPWLRTGKVLACAGILSGVIAAVYFHGEALFLDSWYAWNPARMVFSLGMLPFASVYMADAFINGPQSSWAENAEMGVDV
jgi:hypothetical protein